MSKKPIKNGSTRAFATRVIVGAFSLSFLIVTASVVLCPFLGLKPPQEVFFALLTAMTGVTNSVVAYYFLTKKRAEDKDIKK